jgi:hypothetical protein
MRQVTLSSFLPPKEISVLGQLGQHPAQQSSLLFEALRFPETERANVQVGDVDDLKDGLERHEFAPYS